MPAIHALLMLLSESDGFLDLGANIGLDSAIIGKYQALLPLFEIHCFEANPDTFLRLQKTMAPYRALLHQIALSDHRGEIIFQNGTTSGTYGVADGDSFKIPESEHVLPCERLDAFDIGGRRLFVKFDVAGHELAVLRGAAGLFDQERIKGIFIDGFDDLEVLAFLEGYGFTLLDVYTLSPGRSHRLPAVKGTIGSLEFAVGRSGHEHTGLREP